MTRRERKENRLQKRLEWAAGREAKAAAKFEAVRRIADNIPLGQPILIGHHSEKRHRADIERIDNGMRAGVESEKMADHHRSVADGIERQLDKSIFSDDADAPDALRARIAELEAKRARMVEVNKLYRKKDAAGLAALGVDVEKLTQRLSEAGGRYWGKAPHLPYEMSNLGGRIQADKKRLAAIEAQQARHARAEAAGGLLVEYSAGERFELYPCPACDGGGKGGERWNPLTLTSDNCDRCGGSGKQGRTVAVAQKYISLTFEDKPARAILAALKGAGFYWGHGRWTGETAKLPAGILP